MHAGWGKWWLTTTVLPAKSSDTWFRINSAFEAFNSIISAAENLSPDLMRIEVKSLSRFSAFRMRADSWLSFSGSIWNLSRVLRQQNELHRLRLYLHRKHKACETSYLNPVLPAWVSADRFRMMIRVDDCRNIYDFLLQNYRHLVAVDDALSYLRYPISICEISSDNDDISIWTCEIYLRIRDF